MAKLEAQVPPEMADMGVIRPSKKKGVGRKK
jgi:hypothetical protein